MKGIESKLNSLGLIIPQQLKVPGLTGGSQQGSGGVGGIGSILSSLGGLNKDHELVRHVQQNTGIQDPEQARQYTQHAVDILNEYIQTSPKELMLRIISY